MSLVLREFLERGELDAAIVQVFAYQVRSSDVFLYREELRWVKSAELKLHVESSIPFLSFDDHCFSRQWGLDVGSGGATSLDTVFECSSAAGTFNMDAISFDFSFSNTSLADCVAARSERHPPHLAA